MLGEGYRELRTGRRGYEARRFRGSSSGRTYVRGGSEHFASGSPTGWRFDVYVDEIL